MSKIVWMKTGTDQYQAEVNGLTVKSYKTRMPKEDELGTYQAWVLDVGDELECAVSESRSDARSAFLVRQAIDEYKVRVGEPEAVASKTVVVHVEKGILLGLAHGQAFWGDTDWIAWKAEGNSKVVLFDDQDAAREHVASWQGSGSDNDPDGYVYATLPLAADLEHASPEELRAAGFDQILVEIRAAASAPTP